VSDDAEEFPQLNEDELSKAVETEAQERDKRSLKPVTVTLKDIVRREQLDIPVGPEAKDESMGGGGLNWLQRCTMRFCESSTRSKNYYPTVQTNYPVSVAKPLFWYVIIFILQQLSKNQSYIQKADIKSSIPGLFETEPEQRREQEIPSFDIRNSLVSSSFTPRNDVSPTTPVAPLPESLEEFVSCVPKDNNEKWIRDVQGLLSYHHLGYLYSKFLSPNGVQRSANVKHPLWSSLADEVDIKPRLDSLCEDWLSDDPHPLGGLSPYSVLSELN
jgi:hypothetical protein